MMGNIPQSRQFFSLHANKNELLIFGGVLSNDNFTNSVYLMFLKNRYWMRPFVEGESPAPRNHHACCSVEDKMFVIGGIGRTFCSMDLISLAHGKNQGHWRKVINPSRE